MTRSRGGGGEHSGGDAWQATDGMWAAMAAEEEIGAEMRCEAGMRGVELNNDAGEWI